MNTDFSLAEELKAKRAYETTQQPITRRPGITSVHSARNSEWKSIPETGAGRSTLHAGHIASARFPLHRRSGTNVCGFRPGTVPAACAGAEGRVPQDTKLTRLPDAAAPPMLNKSWTITAEVELPDNRSNGMIVTHGGLEGGYGLYMRDGKPTFVYNFLAIERPTFTGRQALPKGKATIVVDFVYDGGGMGKGGKITMTANGKRIARGRLERTVPIKLSIGEGLDIGVDGGSPVDFTYQMPFAFTGKIAKVTIELKPHATDTQPRNTRRKQIQEMAIAH